MNCYDIHADRWMGWSGMLRTSGLPQSAMLPCIRSRGRAQLTVLSLSDNQLYSGCTVRQGQCDQYCIKPVSSSLPSALLYTNSTLNLVLQAAHSSTHQWIHTLDIPQIFCG